jgi:hypothetical protein
LNETVKQVDKILRSPGCRKTPVFVESTEVAIKASQAFTKERHVFQALFQRYLPLRSEA